MITLHLEAETLAELRVLVQRVLEETNPVPDKGYLVGGDEVFDALTAAAAEPAPQESPPERAKARRPHRRVRPVEAPVAAPVAAQEPDPDPLEEAFESLVEGVAGPPVDYDDEDIVNGEDSSADKAYTTAVDNELLKREVISSLADMFTAGNVKVVRHVLHKYGHGAKSFPEIDPAHFPEIKAALDRNEAA